MSCQTVSCCLAATYALTHSPLRNTDVRVLSQVCGLRLDAIPSIADAVDAAPAGPSLSQFTRLHTLELLGVRKGLHSSWWMAPTLPASLRVLHLHEVEWTPVRAREQLGLLSLRCSRKLDALFCGHLSTS